MKSSKLFCGPAAESQLSDEKLRNPKIYAYDVLKEGTICKEGERMNQSGRL